MNIFVSGTQTGGTQQQLSVLSQILIAARPDYLSTGGCIGVDEEAVQIVIEARTATWGLIETWPADDVAERKKSKFVLGATHLLHPAMPALVRNNRASYCSHLCLFVPKTYAEIQRSGTWAAYRGAKKQQKLCFMIRPDGSIRL